MAVSIANGIDHPSLLMLLADGRLHSGEWLAQELGVSRAAVWKGIERLRMRGIDIEAVPRRGYTLPQSIELLAEGSIRAAVANDRAKRLRSLDIEFDVDSTNTRLLAAAPPPFGFADVMLSELQHAGRGRRGRHWVAPFGGSIALSMGWSFTDASRASPTLSLSVGVAVARALARAGARGVGLKWPNDIWLADRKIGGVLIELRAEASGPAHVVIGVGVNVSLAPSAVTQIEASGVRVAAVADACVAPPSRNFIAGAIIDELLSMLAGFERAGFAAYRAEWAALDVLRGRPARVLTGENVISGTARGVDAQGALLLEAQGRMHEFMSGEVSLRLGGDEL
jgi:BirA family transcriptional regulator, biotin operon repressor / biotin---[acetyl-CoA-carboxylase] ligase